MLCFCLFVYLFVYFLVSLFQLNVDTLISYCKKKKKIKIVTFFNLHYIEMVNKCFPWEKQQILLSIISLEYFDYCDSRWRFCCYAQLITEYAYISWGTKSDHLCASGSCLQVGWIPTHVFMYLHTCRHTDLHTHTGWVIDQHSLLYQSVDRQGLTGSLIHETGYGGITCTYTNAQYHM